MTSREEIIEAVTEQVLAALLAETTPTCSACGSDCVVGCSDKVRAVVANGAARISRRGGADGVPADLARFIDHTLLKPEATAEDIDVLCAEAVEHGFASVCVNPSWVRRAAGNVAGSGVGVSSVVGFPFGATTPEIKAMEARRAIRDGATEIDMVINIGALRSGDFDLVKRDIAMVSDACHERGVKNKVIIEAALLTDEEKVIASRLAKDAKADFVKTSTGFGPGGATVFDVALMREAVGPKLGVKAAGGIRSAEDLKEMVAAGATRIGASAGVAIVSGGETDGGY
jgi:deoxyribose-phosphate aldolase